ncbi:MAG: D-alanine--D-alanine ligase [Gammaproteobacteria bacterium]|nr:D-alanine--D-alanine ligase [Gammaproteobacteria bacterium]
MNKLDKKSKEKFGKVAVLCGGHSSEREISLITGKAVWKALLNKNIDANLVDTKNEFLNQITENNYGSAWIALHGSDGEDGKIQSLLEIMEIKYTGSGPLACSLTMNKLFTKRLLIQNGFKTPDFKLVTNINQFEEIAELLKIPFILKPCSQGSSVGVSIIENQNDFEENFHILKKFKDWIIAESYFVSSEYTAAFLNETILPLIKIDASHENFYNYHAKYFSDATRYICPSGLDLQVEERIKERCFNACKLFDIRGWGRIDFFIDRNDEPVILEINTVPGMTTHSLVPMAAAEVGIDFNQLCFDILEMRTL